MSETLKNTPSLAVYFDPKTLGELGVAGGQLIFHTSHQPTELKKTGLKALLAKTPLGKDEPVSMDIDIGCGLYDEKGNLLEVVWYGNLRSQDEEVRHQGDTFIGMNKAYRPNTVEEFLMIRYGRLHPQIHRLALFVHSASLAPLNKATFGKALLSDNEGNLIHQVSFDTLDDKTTGICLWQLVRTFEGDFRVSALLEPIKGKDCLRLAKKWSIRTPI